MKNIEILNKLSEGNSSDWMQKAEWREQNGTWLNKSAEIALNVISVLKKQGKTKKDLAKEMGVSPQNISKLLSGNANLCLETISKIEYILNINLINVVDDVLQDEDSKFKYDKKVNIFISLSNGISEWQNKYLKVENNFVNKNYIPQA